MRFELVLRPAWLFGAGPNDYLRRVLYMADRDGRVRTGTNQVESPTWIRHLAEAALIATGTYGTYHVTSRGACTRLQFAELVLRAASRPSPPKPWPRCRAATF